MGDVVKVPEPKEFAQVIVQWELVAIVYLLPAGTHQESRPAADESVGGPLHIPYLHLRLVIQAGFDLQSVGKEAVRNYCYPPTLGPAKVTKSLY